MAPIRMTSSLQRRRRSSLALNSFTPAKPGIYGINRPVTFAPNVTPGTFVEPDDMFDPSSPDDFSPMPTLFPPSDTTSSTTRKRCPPGKRRSQGYIPRPPNAFMLFRADFVRQKHVPGSIETNHGSLSKIIGNCWRALPLEEKRIWEIKAKHAKADHKARYPNYRFRPVHNKNKDKKKDKQQPALDEERRCEEVAQLLLEGKKGADLAAAIRDLDQLRSQTPAEQQQQQAFYPPRRPSSVPLPNDYFPYFSHIALPSLPFSSRPSSPVSISHHQRKILGTRRPSSAGPTIMTRSWTLPMAPLEPIFHQDNTPLPEVDASLFHSDWSSSFPTAIINNHVAGVDPNINNHHLFSYPDIMPGPADLQSPISHQGANLLGPLETAPMPMHHPHTTTMTGAAPQLDMSWMQMGLDSSSISKDSSVYSSSPEPREEFLPAPQPHHHHHHLMESPAVSMLMYPSEPMMDSQPPPSSSFDMIGDGQSHFAAALDYANSGLCATTSDDSSTMFHGFPTGLDTMFDGQNYDQNQHHALYDMNVIATHE